MTPNKEIVIPDWFECSRKHDNKEPMSALESFVYEYDDADKVRSNKFHGDLKSVLSEYSASLFTEEQAKDIYTIGYVDGTGYMSNAIAQAFGAEVTSEELNADKAIEKHRNELTDKEK